MAVAELNVIEADWAFLLRALRKRMRRAIGEIEDRRQQCCI
jgi:hypothetical protein